MTSLAIGLLQPSESPTQFVPFATETGKAPDGEFTLLK